jgi:hypothetical protein
MPGLLAAAILALLLAGCATAKEQPVPAACLGAPATLVQALARAPAAVRLADGSRLSTCVARARSDADLQSLGLKLTSAADALRARSATDPAAAAGLGYLAAAVRLGVAGNQGLATQLGRRVERASSLADDAPAAARAALARGAQAGGRSG